ncbi:MAG: hypothetical protein ACXWC6_11905 [Ramlibacter sp.]
MPDQPPSTPNERQDPPSAKDKAQPRRTPSTDMQPEDAGTPESGQPEGRSTPAAPSDGAADESGRRG